MPSRCNRRRQVSPGRGRYRQEAHWRHLWRMCLGLTFALGSAFTTGLPPATPEDSACSSDLLVYSSIVLVGVVDLLDDPRTVHGLVQRFCAEMNRASSCASRQAVLPPIIFE